MQLDRNNEELKEKEQEIAALKDTIKGLERQVISSVKTQFLAAGKEFSTQKQQEHVNSDASQVKQICHVYCLGSLILARVSYRSIRLA